MSILLQNIFDSAVLIHAELTCSVGASVGGVVGCIINIDQTIEPVYDDC